MFLFNQQIILLPLEINISNSKKKMYIKNNNNNLPKQQDNLKSEACGFFFKL